MNLDTQKEIERKIAKAKKGNLLFSSDFRGLGTDVAVRQALSRLCRSGKIKRIAQGIYFIPQIDAVLGELNPSIEKIAEAIAKKDKIRIKPTGAYALNKLGLSTQVPMRFVYLTDGAPRLIKVGKTTIRFKATTPKKLAAQGKLSSLIIQALEELGVENIDDTTKQKIKEILLKEDRKILMNDLKLAPSKVSDFLFTLLNQD